MADSSCSSKSPRCRFSENPTTCPAQTWMAVVLSRLELLSSLMAWNRFARSTVSWGPVTVALAVGWSFPGVGDVSWKWLVLRLPRLSWSMIVDTGMLGRTAAVMTPPKMMVPRIIAAMMPIIVRSCLLEGPQLVSSLLPWGRLNLGRKAWNPSKIEGSGRCACWARCRLLLRWGLSFWFFFALFSDGVRTGCAVSCFVRFTRGRS